MGYGKALGFIAIVLANEAHDTSETTGFKLFRPGDLQRGHRAANSRRLGLEFALRENPFLRYSQSNDSD